MGAILGSSCAPEPLRASFRSANPTERTYAIEAAVREGDQSAVPFIIEQLDSDDPAVRLVAIDALERLTRQTFGYVHYAPRHERVEAIERWVQAYPSQGEEPTSAASRKEAHD